MAREILILIVAGIIIIIFLCAVEYLTGLNVCPFDVAQTEHG